MSLSSHEVGHLPQVELKENNTKRYVSTFISQYMIAGDHDGGSF